jgi:sugar lactone lactonase YvrE
MSLNDPIQALPLPPSLLGESPCWHPSEQALYWCDIPGHQLNRFDPASGAHRAWSFDVEPASCAPLQDGGLLLAMRDGLWRFDTASGRRSLLAHAPYDTARQRFNDGKADPQGRFWVGTIDGPRQPQAALYCFADGQLKRVAEGITVSNGLAWSPDGATLYWSDTKAHLVQAFDFDAAEGSLSHQRVFAQFAPRAAGQALDDYGGRPDGAAVDTEGAYWVAMFEGSRLLRLAPDGQVLSELKLPVRCATMPCFGGHDLRTLYITTARENRPADEVARQPLAGCVLQLRVPVPGLPVNFAVL